MPIPSRRQLLKTLLVGGLTMTLPLDANASPLPKPPTINDKVLQSQYVIVGEVERIDYFELSDISNQRFAQRVVPVPVDTRNLGKLLTIRVLEAIKWDPNPDQLGRRTKRGPPKARPIGPTQPTKQVKLFVRYGSEELLQQFAVGRRLVFFLRPVTLDIQKSNPPEFFGTGLITLIPNGWTRPEPLNRLPEVRKVFANPEPYRGIVFDPQQLKQHD